MDISIVLQAFSIDSLLDARRDGREQTEHEIRAFVDGVVSGAVSRPQAAAWLAFVFLNGMTHEETVALTRAMTESGETLSWPGIEGPFVDKHSTGGVGDKVSLVLAPIWAAMGLRVPMLWALGSGLRGLSFWLCALGFGLRALSFGLLALGSAPCALGSWLWVVRFWL